MIHKENNFQQPGVRFRSFDPARQDRFIKRIAEMLSDPRVTHEVRSIWISYLTQCDKTLGQRMASHFSMKASM